MKAKKERKRHAEERKTARKRRKTARKKKTCTHSAVRATCPITPSPRFRTKTNHFRTKNHEMDRFSGPQNQTLAFEIHWTTLCTHIHTQPTTCAQQSDGSETVASGSLLGSHVTETRASVHDMRERVRDTCAIGKSCDTVCDFICLVPGVCARDCGRAPLLLCCL